MSLRRLLGMLLLLGVLLGLAVWWGRDHPALRPWLPSVLHALPAGPAPAPAAAVRKCRGTSQVSYVDGPCPPGTREQALEGAVIVLPAVRAPAAAAEPAVGASAPLRRLAGPDVSDVQRERALERALGR